MSLPEIPNPLKRGRPRDPKRLGSIVLSAKQLFNDQGFERTTVDEVAKLAGVTKATVYSYFNSKEELFGATVLHRVREEFALGESLSLDPKNPETSLRVISRQFLALIRRDDVLGAHRTLFHSAGVHPELCNTFFHSAPMMVLNEVTRFFEACQKVGTMRSGTPTDAAEQFLALHLGIHHIKALLGLGKPSADDDEALIDRNVRTIVRLYDCADD